MEDLGDYFYQAPALNLKQAQSSLQALAKYGSSLIFVVTKFRQKQENFRQIVICLYV